jgi:arylsulfatase A-like enzyme
MKRYWGVDSFGWGQWSHLVAMCYGYVSLIDDQVARLMSTLEELGVAGDTAVFLTTDHGGMVGAHGLADKGPYLYDEICRIPLLACVPGMRSGARSDAVAYNMDLMPTILELAGAPVPAGLDAASLVPILTGRAGSVRDPVAYVEFHGHQAPYSQRMVRTPEAKYIFNAPAEDELYILTDDPHELVNRVADPACRDVLGRMRAVLGGELVKMEDPILRFYKATRLRG